MSERRISPAAPSVEMPDLARFNGPGRRYWQTLGWRCDSPGSYSQHGRAGDGMLLVTSPAPRLHWRSVLSHDRQALPEHSPEWLDAVCAAGPYADASRHYTFGDGRQFVLPMVRRTGLVGVGGSLESFPAAWGVGGLLGAGLDPEALAGVLVDLESIGAMRIKIRPNPLAADVWAAVMDPAVLGIPHRAHVVDLSGGPDAVLSGMRSNTRSQVRRAERVGVRVEVDRTGGLLDPYYELFLKSLLRWADRQHEPHAMASWRGRRRDPLAKLQSMSKAMGSNFVVTMAFVNDAPAFGTITLLGRTAHFTRGAMDVDLVGSTKPGPLVHWTNMQLACAEGCTQYHMGDSGESQSLAQFKEGLGARPVDYAEYRIERLPYTRTDQAARSLVKRALRFRDT